MNFSPRSQEVQSPSSCQGMASVISSISSKRSPRIGFSPRGQTAVFSRSQTHKSPLLIDSIDDPRSTEPLRPERLISLATGRTPNLHITGLLQHSSSSLARADVNLFA